MLGGKTQTLPTTAHLYVIKEAKALTSSTDTSMLYRIPEKGNAKRSMKLGLIKAITRSQLVTKTSNSKKDVKHQEHNFRHS